MDMPRALVLAVVLLAVACGAQHSSDDGARISSSDWVALTTPPISPRLGAVTAWTGREALFLGGDTSNPCPPNAECMPPPEIARDGAAYDPASGKWRTVADAPVPIEPFASHAVVDDEVFVWSGHTLVSYDASEDHWSRYPTPVGVSDDFLQIEAAGNTVIAMWADGENGVAHYGLYDRAGREWQSLPDDPLTPTFDRVLTWTPVGLVLTAKDRVDNPGSEKPSVVRAAVLDLHALAWRALADSDQIGGYLWTWTGSRMVDPTLGGADGGEVNGYGRTIPYGGVLEPASGTWGTLPNAPKELTGGWPVEAVDGPLVAYAGWLYDDAAGTWTRLPRPEQAPPNPGSPVWAGDQLVVLGGVDYELVYSTDPLSTGAWSYQP